MSTPLPPPPAPTERKGDFEWWAPFAALLTTVGVTIVFAVILAGVTGNTDGDLPPGLTIAATFVQDGLLVATMLGFAVLAGARLAPGTFGLRRTKLLRALVAAVVVFVVFILFLAAWSQLSPNTEDDLLEDLGAKDSTSTLVAVAVLVCLVAPVVEELFFRGFLFPSLQRVMHWIPAGIVAGAMFGLIHAGGTPALFLVPLALFGFLLCALYRRTGSLLPGMAVHAFNNALALVSSVGWDPAGKVALLLGAPLLVVAVAGALSE